jgi:MYXO-CTERM domain-containing protein
MTRGFGGTCLALLVLSPGVASAADFPADPSTYLTEVAKLGPGDTLKLAPGDYTSGLNLFDMNGAAGSPIVIEGPASGAPARFLGKSGKNTIDIKNSSFLTLRDLVLDGQDIDGIDAIKAGGQATDWAHDITIEGCTITGHDGGGTSQQTVGISTKIVTWGWVIRGNVIDGAGTGAYLGNSDGTRAFIGGLIEGNLFKKTLGYNMQIKHQLDRQQSDVPSVPTDTRVTIIRHNVFIKQNLPSPDGARPNLLADGFPDSGPGSDDHYEIYGNFFFHNDDDALFQGNGRIHFHDNVLVDSKNPGVRLVNHSGKTVIDALVYDNTIYDVSTGISFGNAPSGTSLVVGNAVFAATAMSGVTGAVDNVTGTAADAASYVVNPNKTLGQMDFYPKAGSGLKGAAMDLSGANGDADYDRDFNGTTRDFTYRGAYQGEGTNPGWALTGEKKPLAGSGGGGVGGSGGGPSGGAAGSAGSGTGGNANGGAGTGGSSAGGGSAGGATAGGAANKADSGDSGGCGCHVAEQRPAGLFALLLLALMGLGRRRGGLSPSRG